uniref:Secreted protein n=1 Tax=Rhipicephalus appendiculatus TaxID=34631 RepID=A0A131YE59_RHIAP
MAWLLWLLLASVLALFQIYSTATLVRLQPVTSCFLDFRRLLCFVFFFFKSKYIFLPLSPVFVVTGTTLSSCADAPIQTRTRLRRVISQCLHAAIGNGFILTWTARLNAAGGHTHHSSLCATVPSTI